MAKLILRTEKADIDLLETAYRDINVASGLKYKLEDNKTIQYAIPEAIFGCGSVDSKTLMDARNVIESFRSLVTNKDMRQLQIIADILNSSDLQQLLKGFKPNDGNYSATFASRPSVELLFVDDRGNESKTVTIEACWTLTYTKQ